jgi:uncharacterized membrane protein YvlD (DUF360 family)
MKKLFTLFALIVLTTINAQAPQGFNYQAIVRNSSGQLLVNQIVLVKFKILQNSATGNIVYSETQTANTDDLGQINLVVGQGTASTGTFSAINWGGGSYYLGIELNTGTGYVAMGTTQLLSVPYALYALNSGTSKTLGKPTIFITGNITNEQAAAQIAAESGTQTDNVYIESTTGLTAIDLSVITDLTTLIIRNNKNLIDVNLSGLSRTIDVLGISNNPILTTLSFPAYTSNFGEFFIEENATLTSLSFPILKTTANYISFSSNALPSSQINTILNKLLTVTPATGKYINLGGQIPPAPPTGQGIINKQTLINAGNTVFTD